LDPITSLSSAFRPDGTRTERHEGGLEPLEFPYPLPRGMPHTALSTVGELRTANISRAVR
jgi:hypothetical protein